MTSLARRFRICLPLLLLLGLSNSAFAHPMGNFSVNHYSKITLESDSIRVRYLIDLAEIPTFQELQQAGVSATAADPNSAAVTNYVAVRGAELARALILEINGQPVSIHLISSGVIFPPGAGGLPTMKMGFVYEAAYQSNVDRRHVSLQYADNNYPGHTGWKEIVAVASAGSLLQSSVPGTDRSAELSNYPTDLLTSPPQILEAALVAELPPLPAIVTDAQRARASQSAADPKAAKIASSVQVNSVPTKTPELSENPTIAASHESWRAAPPA